ncbi:L,D-transpeptidase [Paenibacillus chartarius]|uniref:L,D-transpeptidase n=1 Tax=Paenibacillus chartarius TaxID=747481 RepID=A0ABV6DM96_9BACL
MEGKPIERKGTDQQVKQFFDRSQIDDPLYLKQFLREHPDQKMAWYLLGREYAAQGKEGKAAYCFAQAGEVYEAFEKRKPDVDLERLKREMTDAQAAERAGGSRAKPQAAAPAQQRRRRRTALLGAGLAALLLFSASASDAEPGAGAAEADRRGADGGAAAAPAQPAAAAPGAAGGAGQPGGPAPGTAGAGQPPAVLYAAPGEAGAGSGAAAAQAMALLAAGSGGEAIAAAGAASPDGQWVYWHVPAKLLFRLGAADETGVRTARPLDPAACACEVVGADAARAVVDAWASAQEQDAVLRSAIAAYTQRYGTAPQQPEQLARPYPDNLLPGVTPEMQARFPIIVQAGSTAVPAAGTAAEPPASSASAKAPPGAQLPPLSEPLRIVVDKKQHRLALLSGNRIVRLYPVGLGGDKTPDGEFTISEKVRNPNNKSNGDFGSRGMTLSDTLYAIHGTNKPSSIGQDESLGCVRMLQADVEELYDMVPHGTKVTIGSGLLPEDAPLSGSGTGSAGGGGNPGNGKGKPAFRLPLQTNDSNPNKVYQWLD